MTLRNPSPEFESEYYNGRKSNTQRHKDRVSGYLFLTGNQRFDLPEIPSPTSATDLRATDPSWELNLWSSMANRWRGRGGDDIPKDWPFHFPFLIFVFYLIYGFIVDFMDLALWANPFVYFIILINRPSWVFKLKKRRRWQHLGVHASLQPLSL